MAARVAPGALLIPSQKPNGAMRATDKTVLMVETIQKARSQFQFQVSLRALKYPYFLREMANTDFGIARFAARYACGGLVFS